MKALALILIILFPPLLIAQNTRSNWTLRECIDHAVVNNIEIRTLEIGVEETRTELSTIRNSRLPTLSVGVSQNFNFGQASVRRYDAANNTWYDVYEDTQTASSSFSASSSMPVFAGGRINHQTKSRKLDLEAAFANLEKAKQNLELQVTSHYLDLLFKKELARTYFQQLELTRQQVERTRMLADMGSVPLSQYLDIRAQEANDQTNLVMAENQERQSRLNLAHLLNITDISTFDIIEPDLSAFISDNIILEDPEELYEVAVATKPHISEVMARLESGRYILKAARAERLPTLSLGLGYGNYYYYNFGSAANENFRNQWRTQGSESVGLSLSIPIFNGFSVRNRIRLAGYAVSRIELELENTKLQIQKEINQAYESATAARSKYLSSSRALEASQQAYDYAAQRYQVGHSTVFELNEAQTRLLVSRSEQLQAKYDFIFRSKILDFYKGNPIALD